MTGTQVDSTERKKCLIGSKTDISDSDSSSESEPEEDRDEMSSDDSSSTESRHKSIRWVRSDSGI